VVSAKDGYYAIGPGSEPVKMSVVLGDGTAGECAETSFHEVENACIFRGRFGSFVPYDYDAYSLRCRQ
jgi:hypothetical protein